MPAEAVLDRIHTMYAACGKCQPDPLFSKDEPFGLTIGSSDLRCVKCQRRPLDAVMGHVLALLIRTGILDRDASLRDVGTPLISFGYPVPYPPRIGNRGVVLVMDYVDKEAAEQIVSEVPEVRGVIKRTGSQEKSVGILDTDKPPHAYELLAGCDIRADVVTSLFGELCIYRAQSEMHIEFPRKSSPKMEILDSLYIRGEITNRTVVDGLAGPGTLGLMCAIGGAKKVILNDAWRPAVESIMLNIEVNRNLLGVKSGWLVDPGKLQKIGNEPVLVGKAGGSLDIEVYQGDFRRLSDVVEPADICLIDPFPAADPKLFAASWKKGKLIVI
ncbi:MAG TPA: hypothetical protein HA257_07260 [Candidatus Methanoperedenaceae archaeon]|nr:hypothetical protein [Candidatus Methanoperedenaceae archaeon]